MTRPTTDRARRAPALLLALLAVSALACSSAPEGGSDGEPAAGPDSERGAAPAVEPLVGPHEVTAPITAGDLLANERFWPDIVAVTRVDGPTDGDGALKPGLRGALVRVEEDGGVRIAFGRHGNHVLPLESTDLLDRANAIRTGARHKLGPNFVVHYGTQFVDLSGPEDAPFPTARLQGAERFLCLFADPKNPGFAAQAAALAELAETAGVQPLLFPLGLPQGDLASVRKALGAAGWTVPSAYPAAAEVHARSLLGAVPDRATALLVSREGRRLGLAPIDEPAGLAALRAAVAAGPIAFAPVAAR